MTAVKELTSNSREKKVTESASRGRRKARTNLDFEQGEL